MGKPFSLQSPEQVAKEYGGNKQKIAQAAQMGQVDPTAAVLAGMFIDRMRSAQSLEQGAQPTVAQQVLAPPAPASAPPAPPASGAPPMGMAPPMAPPPMAPQAPPMAPPMGMASGGLTTLPIPDDMFDEPQYGGGGIVAFAEAGEVESDLMRLARIVSDPDASPEERNAAQKELVSRRPPEAPTPLGRIKSSISDYLYQTPEELALGAARLERSDLLRKQADELSAASTLVSTISSTDRANNLEKAKRLRLEASARDRGEPTSTTSAPDSGAEYTGGGGNAPRGHLAPKAAAPKGGQPGLGAPRVDPVDPEVAKAPPDVAAPQAPAAPEKDYAALYADAMAARDGYPALPAGESIADQKKQDFNMALAQMGFGIAAGTSPNALTNIGAGMSGAVPGMQKAMDRRREAQRDADKADFARREAVYGQKNAARTEALGLLNAAEERKDARAKLAQDALEGGLDRASAERRNAATIAGGLANTQISSGAPTAALQAAAAIQADNPGMSKTEALQRFYAMSERAGTDQTLTYRDKATAAAQTDNRWRQAKTEAAKKALIDEYYRAMYGGSAAAPAPAAGAPWTKSYSKAG
ncbi:hypothetical protein UFOVP1058_24 [uncultured Caudovirales phage]|uniref:Uncharacterized protein n=1 Tax=uncultured Caudovirales phage TaxID=2100421 RepID=A0A6J5NHQ1_9CAUD|nr:hypothetical protein UFOVP656_56 [uncultured Caudovirales phage]CAB4167259.1 hypothetical protein UFOVP857_9 [uncultured Caudovirales phage]CAB4168456.1 hypothetical protein UFOVP879_37 [uncultured Caudovirales phage]CAB4181271.1 hypothetical protein UFOVP1058_24 [uncultured Caudovirales phage]CAB4195852.1 hypothetical protein UFOVP1289_48 [uncultured Caudovirales phage]